LRENCFWLRPQALLAKISENLSLAKRTDAKEIQNQMLIALRAKALPRARQNSGHKATYNAWSRGGSNLPVNLF